MPRMSSEVVTIVDITAPDMVRDRQQRRVYKCNKNVAPFYTRSYLCLYNKTDDRRESVKSFRKLNVSALGFLRL